MVGEHERAVRAREGAREVDHADVRERAIFPAADRGKHLEPVALGENAIGIDLLGVDDERRRLVAGYAKVLQDRAGGPSRAPHRELLAPTGPLAELAMEHEGDHVA